VVERKSRENSVLLGLNIAQLTVLSVEIDDLKKFQKARQELS
jgi:hypothetical protein